MSHLPPWGQGLDTVHDGAFDTARVICHLAATMGQGPDTVHDGAFDSAKHATSDEQERAARVSRRLHALGPRSTARCHLPGLKL